MITAYVFLEFVHLVRQELIEKQTHVKVSPPAYKSTSRFTDMQIKEQK